MTLPNGTDGVLDDKFAYQQYNRMKNHWRGASVPSDAQAGMVFSRDSDDRLSHQASAQEYLVFQGDIVCSNNQVVCANNGVVITLPV